MQIALEDCQDSDVVRRAGLVHLEGPYPLLLLAAFVDHLVQILPYAFAVAYQAGRLVADDLDPCPDGLVVRQDAVAILLDEERRLEACWPSSCQRDVKRFWPRLAVHCIAQERDVSREPSSLRTPS